jgi:hypothetical protein
MLYLILGDTGVLSTINNNWQGSLEGNKNSHPPFHLESVSGKPTLIMGNDMGSRV